VFIDWDNPKVVEDQRWYLIEIPAIDSDIFKMDNYLVFIENKFSHRESFK
jgi:hypothetical protein